jgi:hypothetical protein
MCFSCHRYALASAATLNLAVQVNLRRNKTLGSCCGFGRYAYLDVQVSLRPNKTSRSCCPGVRLKPLIHLSAFPDAAVRRLALRKARRILETPFQVKDTKGFETSIPCVVSETAARSRFALHLVLIGYGQRPVSTWGWSQHFMHRHTGYIRH